MHEAAHAGESNFYIQEKTYSDALQMIVLCHDSNMGGGSQRYSSSSCSSRSSSGSISVSSCTVVVGEYEYYYYYY